MVLVTGATGFVGSHLMIELLEDGQSVRGLYRDDLKREAAISLFAFYGKQHLLEKLEWHHGDITDIPSLEAAFGGIDFVYHCAAIVSFDPGDEEILRKNNIEGTANIVNLSLAHQVKKLCHVSSIAALGDPGEDETTISETTEWNPEKYHSDYAISKYGAEMEVWRAQQEGLEVVVVNPGVIMGPFSTCEGWQSGSGKIFTKAAAGLSSYTKGSTGFISVYDVVKIMRLLMQSDISGERFVLVSEDVRFDVLLKFITDALNIAFPKRYAPKWLTSIAWRLDWVSSKVFFTKRKLSKAMAASLHGKDLYSAQKVREMLDFEFIPVEKTVRDTSGYFLSKGC